MFLLLDDCENGNVTLRNGTDNSNGRVEVCQDGIWVSISCYWSTWDASVVCRQLGYTNEGTAL